MKENNQEIYQRYILSSKEAALDYAIRLYANKPQKEIIRAAEEFERYFMAECKDIEADVVPFGVVK